MMIQYMTMVVAAKRNDGVLSPEIVKTKNPEEGC